MKSHANYVHDPSLLTALACSQNIDTTFAQEVPGEWCPTTLLLMSSTSVSLIFMECGTNPVQTPNPCPRWDSCTSPSCPLNQCMALPHHSPPGEDGTLYGQPPHHAFLSPTSPL